MLTAETITMRSNRLAELIEERLGVRGKGLETKLRRAGRLLPGWLRHEAEQLIQAQQMAGHPKLMMQADTSALESGFRRCEQWLQSIDPAERRKDRLLRFLGLNALNLLIVVAAFVAYLVWTGHV